MHARALEGIRVIDFGQAVAGPFVTLLLCSMGAEVIKVESEKRPDMLRLLERISGWSQDNGVDKSPAFNQYNLGKLGVTLDLTKPAAVELAKQLVSTSNVVVENFASGVMDRLGLGYPVLKAVKPDIIMLSCSLSGANGPEAGFTGYAPIFAAVSGEAHLTGYPGGLPAQINNQPDVTASALGAVALLAALLHWQVTGEGQHIDLSCREAISCLIGDALMDYTLNGRIQSRTANREEGIAPHNCYRCAGEDDWVSIAVATEEEWAALCEAMGSPPWTREEWAVSREGRCANEDRLDGLIHEWTSTQSHIKIMELLQAKGVAAMPSFNAEDIFNDPHLRERGAFTTIEHPLLGLQTIFSIPWRYSLTPPRLERPAPLLGEHNEYVFGTLLGLGARRVEELKREGIIL